MSAPMWNSYSNPDYKISKKGVADLPVFNGDHAKYSHWKNKLTDFVCENNAYWKALLKHSQESLNILSYQVLAATTYGASNGWDLAMDLWNLISKRIGTDL